MLTNASTLAKMSQRIAQTVKNRTENLSDLSTSPNAANVFESALADRELDCKVLLIEDKLETLNLKSKTRGKRQTLNS